MADAYDDFMMKVRRHPLLTPNEELILGHQIQDMLQLKAELSGTTPTAAQRRTLRRGERARSRMVEANLRLVAKIANKYRTPAVDIMDQIQLGNLGLLLAAEKFDPARGYKFGTYAYWWIRQSITRGFEQKNLIRIPEQTQQKTLRVKEILATTSMTFLEACQSVKIDPDCVAAAMRADCLSLDYLLNSSGSDPTPLSELIPSNEADLYENLSDDEMAGLAGDLLEGLAPNDRYIVTSAANGMTFVDIGRRLGLAGCTISERYKRLIARMKGNYVVLQPSLLDYEQAC
jgi:RNA polymerase primary sigma factor